MHDHLNGNDFKFSQLPLAEDCENLLPQSQVPLERRPRSEWPLFRGGSALLLLISCTLAGLCGIWIGGYLALSPSSCTTQTSQYAPILNDMSLSYSTIQFNGSLLKENSYRQDAGPEVDAAWASLGVDYRSIIVPSTLAEKSGLQADQVKISQKYGGGFPANVEGLHHLHCLNLLRQSLYYNFDYYHERGQGAFKNKDHILKHHVSHCLDVLRQQLMCTVDIGVLGQVWIHPEAPEAYVDFNTMHKCRNFDAVRQWAEERQMPKEVPGDWLEPPKIDDRIYEEIP